VLCAFATPDETLAGRGSAHSRSFVLEFANSTAPGVHCYAVHEQIMNIACCDSGIHTPEFLEPSHAARGAGRPRGRSVTGRRSYQGRPTPSAAPVRSRSRRCAGCCASSWQATAFGRAADEGPRGTSHAATARDPGDRVDGPVTGPPRPTRLIRAGHSQSIGRRGCSLPDLFDLIPDRCRRAHSVLQRSGTATPSPRRVRVRSASRRCK
jgi:hypothetical protein